MLQISSISAVLSVFFDEPSREHYLMDVSRKAKLAHTSVKKNLLVLEREGLMRRRFQKKGSRKFPVYLAAVEDSRFRRHKLLHNLAALYDSGLAEFLIERLAPKVIVVFGSYRRGEDREDSDIDLFVEGVEEKIDVSAFERKLKRKIQLHIKSDFTKYPKELKNNIVNGVVLGGFLEGFK